MSSWYCQLDGEISGPLSVDELHYLKHRGKLSVDTLVRDGTHGPWVNAGSVADIFPLGWGPEGLTQSGVIERRALADVEASTKLSLATQSSEPITGERLEVSASDAQADETRERILIATCILAGILLLLLLLLLLNLLGGSEGRVADHGGGAQQGSGMGVTDTAADQQNQPTDQGSDDAGEQVVFEGEIADERAVESASNGERPPAEEEPPPTAIFQIQDFDNTAPGDPLGEVGGGLGDFRERLDREGGQSGEVQITLIWNNSNDLDLHVICPSGEEINFNHKRSQCNGSLDVDMNASGRQSLEPVENVFWPDSGAPIGQYRVFVKHYENKGAQDPTQFEVAVRYGGTVKKFSGSVRWNQVKAIHTFEVD